MRENIQKLPPTDSVWRQRRIDELLSQSVISGELRNIRSEANDCQIYGRLGVKKPRFRFVSEFHEAVYDLRNRVVYEGEWNDSHKQIAKNYGVVKSDYDWDGRRRCISAVSWKLRAAQNIKVLAIDTMYIFSYDDLMAMQNAGYTVMDPEYQWIVERASSQEGYVLVPSELSWRY